MKNSLFLFALAAIVSSPLYAQQPQIADLIERFDADNDGKLNKEERQQAAAALREAKQKTESTKQDAIKKFDTNGNGRLEGAELTNFRKFAAAQKRGEKVDNQPTPKQGQPQRVGDNGNFGVGGAGKNGAFGFGGQIPQQQQGNNGNFGFGGAGGNAFGFGGAGGNGGFGFGGQQGRNEQNGNNNNGNFGNGNFGFGGAGGNGGFGFGGQVPNMKNLGVGVGQVQAFTRQMQAFGMGQAMQAQQKANQLQKAGQQRGRAIGVGGAPGQIKKRRRGQR